MKSYISRFSEPLEDKKVRCTLCNHRCVISEGKTGLCSVRRNENGSLVSDVYGNLIAENIDPIEKKPLFHVLPGSRSLSIATSGCNFHCKFCQNCEISQNLIQGKNVAPERVVEEAIRTNCASIAYTYTEPTVFMEFALDTAKLAHEKGLLNLFVTNGYETPEAIAEMKGLIDAANVDLKSFQDSFYRRLCGARLSGVLDAIKRMHEAGIFLEVTTLVIPGENDDPEDIGKVAGFVASLDKNIPWHISRFHPAHKLLDKPVTPTEKLKQAFKIGRDSGLRYVYLGNVPFSGYEDTTCPECGATVVSRTGFTASEINLKGTSCTACGASLPFLLKN